MKLQVSEMACTMGNPRQMGCTNDVTIGRHWVGHMGSLCAISYNCIRILVLAK